MPLSLLAGPANAGKVALLLERYLGALDADPILIVPNRPDVDRAERELLDPRRRAAWAARSAPSTTSSSGSRGATARTGR